MCIVEENPYAARSPIMQSVGPQSCLDRDSTRDLPILDLSPLGYWFKKKPFTLLDRVTLQGAYPIRNWQPSTICPLQESTPLLFPLSFAYTIVLSVRARARVLEPKRTSSSSRATLLSTNYMHLIIKTWHSPSK